MAQRLVLKSEDGKLTLKEIGTFYNTALQYGVPLTDEVEVSVEGKSILFTKALPLRVRVVGGKKVVLRPKTAQRRAVEKQIQEHREKRKNGEHEEGHIPPVGKKSASKPQKAKCPVCGIRKPIVKIGPVRSIKPHISKGEPCSGGGKQV